MLRVDGTDLFYYSIQLESDARINYRFVRDFEAILDPRNDLETLSDVFNAEMDLVEEYQVSPMSWLAMPEWEPPEHLSAPSSETPRGRLVERNFTSEALGGERTVQIYLPPGYDDGEARYPVAYYHGGAAALSAGRVPRSLDNLIAAGQPPVIAVFMDEPPFLGRFAPLIEVHDAYSRMWAKELVPLIDTSFRTIDEPSARAALGGGRFAYLALYATLRELGVATKLGLQSIHMNDNRREVLEALASSYRGPTLDVYLDWGTHDAWSPRENWDHRPRNRAFFALLDEMGHDVDGGKVRDGTGWSSWQNRTDRVYRALFRD
jgi:enterochelin esterase-like enzyme